MSDKDKKPAGDKKAAKKATHKITVKTDGFRRCGRAWSGETEIVEGELTAKELKVLEKDSMFTVVKL